jgi:hypothetical protein
MAQMVTTARRDPLENLTVLTPVVFEMVAKAISTL